MDSHVVQLLSDSYLRRVLPTMVKLEFILRHIYNKNVNLSHKIITVDTFRFNKNVDFFT